MSRASGGLTKWFSEDWVDIGSKKNEDVFNNQLKFDVHLIKLDCSVEWVENSIIDTVNLLRSDIFPKPALNCEYCNYLKKRWRLSIT